MHINFDSIDETVIPHFKGGEKEVAARMFFDGSVRIMKSTLIPGATIGWHCHEDSCEVMYVLSGVGKILEEDGESLMYPGQGCYCPKGKSHSLVNEGEEDLVIFAVVPQQ